MIANIILVASLLLNIIPTIALADRRSEDVGAAYIVWGVLMVIGVVGHLIISKFILG